MSWIASNPILATSLLLTTLFVLLNLLAYRHAQSMTRFIPGGGWKRKPEALTRLEKLRALVGGVRLCRPNLPGRPDALGLAYQTHRFAGADGELEAWYLPCPQAGGMVLLFHGYNGCKAKLLAEARGWYDLGYSCFLVDFPGCGGSAGDRTTIGYGEAWDVVRAVEYVRGTWGVTDLTLFGHSMGAAAILRAVAVHGLQAGALVLECPFDRLLTTVKARFAAMGVPAFPAAHLLVFWGGIQHGYNGFRHNPVDYARRVHCPVLLLHGSEDRRVTCREVQAVFDALPGEKHMHIFQSLGHEAYAAARPREWADCITTFLHRRALAQRAGLDGSAMLASPAP